MKRLITIWATAIDALSLLYGVKVKRAECSSLTAAVNDGGVRVILAKPITYMNLSGQAVKAYCANMTRA